MSGIVGIVNNDGAPVDRGLLERLTAFLDYRGPDARAIWVDGHVGFGHTMLRTTVESANERQPLSLDGRVWINADARLDGRAELRRAIANKGIERLDDANDIELLLHAYSVWDIQCVEHLLGDFAFAVWDRATQRLFIARDHFGVKPFFYSRVGNAFIFSNTLNCLRMHPAISDTLNDVAIGDFLLFGLNYDPATTTFADVQRLPAAHCLTLAGDSLAVRKYWSLPTDGHVRYRNSAEYVDHFREILRTAVDDRLRTDRIACEMSGGLDSTSIAATASEILTQKGGHFALKAHTVVYDRLIPDRERHFAGLAADALNIPTSFIPADGYPLFDESTNNPMSEPEPFYVGTQAAMQAEFYQQVTASSRVLLTGWDGDTLLADSPQPYFYNLIKTGKLSELAAGWAWFIGVQHALPPMGVRTWIKRRLGKYPVPWAFPAWIDPALESRVNLRDRLAQKNMEGKPLNPMRPLASKIFALPTWWPLFESYDPGMTGFPVEARHPLIDRRLVEFILAIPPVPWSMDKHILRVSMSGVLPENVRNRPKSPLAGDPVVQLLRGLDKHLIDQFEPNPSLAKYVTLRSVPSLGAEGNASAVWTNLRPFLLNRWLGSAIPFKSGRGYSPSETKRVLGKVT